MAAAQDTKRTILVFGSNGVVGSEVLRSLLHKHKPEGLDDDWNGPFFWDEIVLVGRRFPPIVTTDKDGQDGQTKGPKVTKVELTSLANIIDEQAPQNEKLKDLQVDACIIAIGLSNPQNVDLAFWHLVEIEMVGAITRMAKNMGARHVSLLSAVDSDDDPVALSEAKLVPTSTNNSGNGYKRMGWLRMLSHYPQMKGLSEQAVIRNAATEGTGKDGTPTRTCQVTIMRPSNIVTESFRYGCLDRFLFRIHPVLDRWLLPARYHSVHVRLLGLAFAKAAENHIRKLEAGDVIDTSTAQTSELSTLIPSEAPDEAVVRYIYPDFARIAGEDFKEIKEFVKGPHFEL